MKLVDANVLLYAVNGDAPHHHASRTWLDRSLAGADTVGFTWIALIAFLRISTKTGLFPRPLTVDDALQQVEDWLAAPYARVLHPGPAHVDALRPAVQLVTTAGNLVNDAHLAAIALENRADVVTYDNDFARFPGLRWARPDDLLP